MILTVAFAAVSQRRKVLHMEIRIGVKHVAREVGIETDASYDDVVAQIEEAVKNGSLLQLSGVKGRKIAVPGDSIAYVDFDGRRPGPVGFAHQA